MGVTLCYLTTRKNCRIEWWLDSLALQLKPEDDVRILVVDFWAKERATIPRVNPIEPDWIMDRIKGFKHVEPKPNVWQGAHRLTKEQWFAAANARNTALCLCATDWIAYCDDLSVLSPGWLDAVRRAMAGNYIVLGAYKKVVNLKVERGVIVSFEEYASGLDSRLKHPGGVISCGGDWLYGCSLAGPTEAFVSVNGWPEMCDGMGFEDSCMGICLGNTHRYSFRYDRQMLTLESEEAHHEEPRFKGVDFGRSPKDKSHALLNIAKGSSWFPNYFPEGGIRKLREQVLAGEPFPLQQIPQHEFFTGTPLVDL
jgi:hypothetical protein